MKKKTPGEILMGAGPYITKRHRAAVVHAMTFLQGGAIALALLLYIAFVYSVVHALAIVWDPSNLHVGPTVLLLARAWLGILGATTVYILGWLWKTRA